MANSEFPRARRLTHASEFDAVFKQARYRVSRPEFLLLAIETGAAEGSRIGTVVSKKVSGNSVKRNRIRRLIKEAFRTGFREAGLDIVIVARPGVNRKDNPGLLKILGHLFGSVTEQRQKHANL